jgi:glycosyltransferase involved in cell wall biosynthesis
MKILFIGEPNSSNTVSWIEGLRRQGCEVYLASARTDGDDGSIPIGSPKLSARMRILTGATSLRKIIQDIKPDILLAYRITSYGYLAARTGFHPLVLAAQNEQIVYLPKPSRIRRFALERFVRCAVKKADLIHSWGDNITNGLLKYGADRNKILTLHRGIDMDAFHIGRSKQFNPESPVFVSTRSLYPEYLIDKVIDAFALLAEKIPGARLEIAGGGTEEKILKAKAMSLGMAGKICFHGRLSNAELVELLKSSDVYVSIIETEGVSSSLIESAACSLLPIVTDMPASRLIVDDGVNGLFVRDISLEAICSAMTKSVENYEKMRPALVQNSKRIKDAFNRDKNQSIFVEKYKKLLESY